MKRILFLFLPFLPYLVTAQVAKDTVTVLTIADIPAAQIRDTTNLTFVQDNAFAKATFDSLAKYTRVKLIGDRGDITVSGSTGLTWELDAGVVDSMQLSAGAVVLPGAKVTGTLPVSKGGTNSTTAQGAINTLAGATTSGQYLRGNGSNVVMSAIQAADVPTLNQNTTGSAATLTTSRTIQTNLASTSAASFNGSANITPGVTGTLPVGNGGTGRTTAPAGYILHGNGTIVDTSAQLLWDSTNRSLLVGTTGGATAAKLRIGGRIDIVDPDSTTLDDNFIYVYNAATTGATTTNSEFGFQVAGPGSSSINQGPTLLLRGNDFDRAPLGTGQKGLIGISAGTIPGATGNQGIINFTAGGSERMRITPAGEVWIGYTADQGAYLLQVNSQIFATNATIATSDARYKENVTPLGGTLEKIMQLKPVSFTFIPDSENNFSEFEEVGFIAQEVENTLSTETYSRSIVKPLNETDDKSPLGISETKMIPLLVKAIQEQQAQIEALKTRISQLENK